MTKFEQPSFTHGPNSQQYKDNYDKTFNKRDNSKCQFNDTCARTPLEGNEWCNFHLVTEGVKLDKEEDTAEDVALPVDEEDSEKTVFPPFENACCGTGCYGCPTMEKVEAEKAETFKESGSCCVSGCPECPTGE
jgi:hypothetical protein